MSRSYRPRCAATAIGSLPHTEVEQASRLMLEALPEVPVWPQLPSISFLENMYAQFSEGMAGIRMDLDDEKIWFEAGEEGVEGLEEFYSRIIESDIDYFAISEDYAHGLRFFLEEADLEGKPVVKGQVTGPISFGLTVTDQDKRPSLYNDILAEVALKALNAKGLWQAREMKKRAPDSLVLVFCDEPYLASVGSALVSVSREKVVDSISQCIEGWGDLTGIHCCANTDWSQVFATGADVINFDAFYYMDKFMAYKPEIRSHLEEGGMIAWGVVPNNEEVFKVSSEQLVEVLDGVIRELASEGLEDDDVFAASFITPS